MHNYLLRYPLLISFLTCLLISNHSYSQEFLPKLDQFKSLQKDSDNFYFKEIWIKSKDINKHDLSGFMTRAARKVELGYFKEAVSDINEAIRIDTLNSQSYFYKAFVLLKCDSVQSAIYNINKSIALNDTNKYSVYFLGEIYMHLGKTREADSLFNRSIGIDKKYYEPYFGLANIQMMNNSYWKADSLYDKVIELNPGFSMAYFNLAVANLVRDRDKALRSVNKCIDLTPSFAQAYYVRGYLKRNMNLISSTYRDWKKAIELDPDNMLYHVSLGFLNIADKNYETGFNEISGILAKAKLKNLFTYFEQSEREKIANDFLSQVLTYNSQSGKLSPQEKEKIINALCQFFLGKFKNAETIYSSLLTSSSSPGLVHYLRGFNLEYLHQADLSLQSYNTSINQKVFPNEAFLRKGIVLNITGKNDSSIQTLKKFIRNNDSTRLAYRTLASSYVNVLKYDSAIFQFNKLINSDSTELDIYFDRAFCFKELGKYQDAIKDCFHILNYKPYNIETICFLADCKYTSGDTTGAYNLLTETHNRFHFLTENGYFIRGSINLSYTRYDSAIIDYNNVLHFNPKHLDALIYRGLCYYCKQNYAEAKKDFTSAIDLKNNELTALYTRGLANIKLNNLDEAYSDLKKAESFGHPLARRVILLYLKNYKPSDSKN